MRSVEEVEGWNGKEVNEGGRRSERNGYGGTDRARSGHVLVSNHNKPMMNQTQNVCSIECVLYSITQNKSILSWTCHIIIHAGNIILHTMSHHHTYTLRAVCLRQCPLSVCACVCARARECVRACMYVHISNSFCMHLCLFSHSLSLSLSLFLSLCSNGVPPCSSGCWQKLKDL